MASTIFRRVPPPKRSGRAHCRSTREVRPQVWHKARQLDPGPGQPQKRWWGPTANDLPPRVRVRGHDAGPDFLGEVGNRVGIGDGGEQAEVDDGAAIRRRVRGAGLVVFDVCRVGNDGGANTGDLIEQTPLIHRAAEINA